MADQNVFAEVLRIILETQGEDGLKAMIKGLTQLSSKSDESAGKASHLSDELAKLADTSENIRNFVKLKASITETGTALDKAKLRMHELAVEMGATATPSKSLENATARAASQVERLTKLQNRQTAELGRVSLALRSAGVDTNNVARAYADLQDRFAKVSQQANATASAVGKVGADKGLEGSLRKSSAALDLISGRLLAVSGAAAAAVTGLGAVAAAGTAAFFSGAISSATTLESALAEVRAVSGASADEMERLKTAAEEGGRTTKFSTLEAAQALGELARATGTAQGAIAALPATLNLAQAAGIGVAQAAQFITTTLTQFGLAGDQASRVADVLARAANSTTADVQGLGDALSYAAPLAKQLGLDTEQTVAVIGALADQGFRGERAGTALRSVFSEMLDPASAFGKALRDLGIDSTNFTEVISGLAKAGDRGKEAILQLDAAARPAILSLVNSGGTAIKQLETDLRAASGAAAETAQVMGANAAGAAEAMSDAFDRARRSLVEPILEPLQKELIALTSELEAFAQTPEFEEIKGALTDLFVNGAQAVREFFSAVDFKTMAQDIRQFVETANSSITLFRENIAPIVAYIEMMGDQWSVTFNAIQVVIYGVASAFTKLLEIISKLGQVTRYLPVQAMLEWATGTGEAFDKASQAAAGFGAASEAMATKAVDNIEDLSASLVDMATVYTGTVESTAAADTTAAAAAKEHAAASGEQGAAAKSATEALTQQAAAAQAAASGNALAADQLERDAQRLKQAFSDLGIQSQENLQRAAESAKRNFEAIREAVGAGNATVEDARRAFTAYAQAARAAVAESSDSAKTRVESELQVLDVITRVNHGLDDMGDAGRTAGQGIAEGAAQGVSALSAVGSAASSAASSTTKAGDAAKKTGNDWFTASLAGQKFALVNREISESAMEQLKHMHTTDFMSIAGLNAFTESINQQGKALDAELERLKAANAEFDELGSRRKELQTRFNLLGAGDIEKLLQAEQELTRNREKAAQQEQQRQAELLQSTEQRADIEKQIGAGSQPTTRTGNQPVASSAKRVIIELRAGNESVELEGPDGSDVVTEKILRGLRHSQSVAVRRRR